MGRMPHWNAKYALAVTLPNTMLIAIDLNLDAVSHCHDYITSFGQHSIHFLFKLSTFSIIKSRSNIEKSY